MDKEEPLNWEPPSCDICGTTDVLYAGDAGNTGTTKIYWRICPKCTKKRWKLNKLTPSSLQYINQSTGEKRIVQIQ